MKPLHYETQGSNSYVIYEIDANESIDSMSLGMLTNNKIHGLAPALFTQMDDKKYVKYNVSSKVAISQLFEGVVSKRRLVGIFKEIVAAMLSAEEYMLDLNSILLDPEYIFADAVTFETAMICLPIAGATARSSSELGRFFKNIIVNAQLDQTENCDHVAPILNYLNSTPAVSLADFKVLLDGISASKREPKPVSHKPQAETPKPVAPVEHHSLPKSGSSAAVSGASANHSVTPKHQNRQHSGSIPPVETPPTEQKMPSQADEKPISLFYLLQHYNKDNAAAYKAQQEAKKAKKSVAASTSFAVPGQEQKTPNVSFAIPGQQPAEPQKPAEAQPPVAAHKPAEAHKPAPETPAVNPQPSVQPAEPIDFEETVFIGHHAEFGEAYLIRIKNNERIALDRPIFRIGKKRNYVDYLVSDNNAVSRTHASIINNNGEFFIVDTNSTNYTYVDGKMIQSNVQVPLAHGAKIRLANEDFEFRMK